MQILVRRVGGLAAAGLLIALWTACGQVYRPVVIPCSTGGVPGCPVPNNPKPGNFHAVFGITTNSANNPGGAMQIDVSGDSILGETPTSDPSMPNLGNIPTHAAIATNDARVFVASAGSVVAGGVDTISTFTPVFQSTTASGLGTVSTIALPAGSQPVFLNSTESNFMYVADYGTNSVSGINTTSNVVTLTAAVGKNPVSLAELPNGLKLYVANEGDNTVDSLNTIDLSPVTGFTGLAAPIWVVARGDSQKVYVLTAGDGQVVTIDTASDTVTSSLPVGVGANFLYFDPILNRLYVTNPVTQMVYVFSDTGGTVNGVAADVPLQLAVIPFTAGSEACPAGCMPSSVTALGDGSRFYVASYQTYPTGTVSTCPDANVAGACVVPWLTVFNANSFAVQYPSAPTLKLLSPISTTFAATQYAVPPVASCATAPIYPALYAPTDTRFRVFTTASVDSTRVYVSLCDAGAVAVINTTDANANNSGTAVPPDSLVLDLATAPAACQQASCSNTAAITAFSITNNVVTFQAANSFTPGQTLTISGLSTGTYLNGSTLTVLATGLSATQFECNFTNANESLTTDSGTAIPQPPSQNPVFLFTGQ